MKNCCNYCITNDFSCPMKDCKHWIDYEKDLNCTLIAVESHGAMTLREVSERLGISFVRVKQIQDRVIKKLSNLNVKFN